MTSTLVFDIMQFFPSLNYFTFLEKLVLTLKLNVFFSNYLVSRKTQYCWNKFSLPFFNVDIRMGQGSVLSSILSALYLTLILHILENYLKILIISVFILSFVDNGLFITQSKSFFHFKLISFL